MHLSLFVSAALALPQLALAQASSDVSFPAGASGAEVSGKITGHGYADYRLGAKGGQTMSVELSVTGGDGDGTVYFNILPPGSAGEAIHIGSMEGNSAEIVLPESGIYTIRVYQMGNDEDTGKTSAYDIDVSIE